MVYCSVLRYEDFAASPTAGARGLLNFFGLDVDDNVFEFLRENTHKSAKKSMSLMRYTYYVLLPIPIKMVQVPKKAQSRIPNTYCPPIKSNQYYSQPFNFFTQMTLALYVLTNMLNHLHRDSESTPCHWKHELPFDEVAAIQNECREAMNLWGYKIYKKKWQLKRSSLTDSVLTFKWRHGESII